MTDPKDDDKKKNDETDALGLRSPSSNDYDKANEKQDEEDKNMRDKAKEEK